MRALVVGCGNLGSEVARRLTARGDIVTGTTTTPGRLAEVEAAAGTAILLDGGDAEAMTAAVSEHDIVAVTVSPPVAGSMTVEGRAASYRRVLFETCANATAVGRPVVFASSISVYGDADADPVTEETPATDADDPSPRWFSAAEHVVLGAGGTVLRLPDLYGHPDDIDFATRVRYAVEHLAGSVPFMGEARFVRLHVADAARAIVHAIDRGLTGAYNVVPDGGWGTNRDVFDDLADRIGVERLEFRGEIRTPVGRISDERFRSTGFEFEHVESSVE